MSELIPNLVVDVGAVSVSLLLLWRHLSFVHPITPYLFFHIYCFTWRAWALFNGSTPMYGDQPQFEVIRPDEFVRAMYYADLSLSAISLGALLSHRRRKLKSSGVLQTPIDPRHIWGVTFLLLPIGLVFLILRRIGTVEGEYAGIVGMISFWPPAILLVWIFLKGFRWYLMIPMAIYLISVGLQGYHRFMMALPLIFLAGLYLQMRRKRWPGVYGVMALVLFGIIFPDLKDIGRAYQTESQETVFQLLERSFDFRNRENTSDYLDQFAGAVTMIDRKGKFYYGETYLYSVTLPIPRFLWPEKPGLGNHVIAIATEHRQYDKEGRIITLIGESYINFSIIGVVAIPFLLGWGLTRWYLNVQSGVFHSLNHYVYLSIYITLIQVYRDGLSAFFYFGVFQNAPMVALILLHYLFPNRDQQQDYYHFQSRPN